MSFPLLFRAVGASVCVLSACPASAQNWTFDARKIAIGGFVGTDNVAAPPLDKNGDYRSIVLPFGLIQTIRRFDTMNPTNDEFDLVRTAERAASPIHFVFGRDDGGTSAISRFVTDAKNGELSTDLSDYRGFQLSEEILAEGLASPSWGKQITLRRTTGGSTHGLYIGAGPYMSARTSTSIDPQLSAILGSSDPHYLPNTRMVIDSSSFAEIALAVTGGYRGRLAFGSGALASRNGLYVGANYHYLRGFHFQDGEIGVRFNTDASGMLSLNASSDPSLAIDRRVASRGHGFAADVGFTAVVNRWEAGLGINGIANRIVWTDVEFTRFALGNLTDGEDFEESDTVVTDDVRIELPVDVRGHVRYDGDQWSVIGEVGHGFQGTSFHTGFEQRFSRIDVRGGARFVRHRWEPTGGVGLNLTGRIALDLAVFSSSANVQRKRHLAVAASLRLMGQN